MRYPMYRTVDNLIGLVPWKGNEKKDEARVLLLRLESIAVLEYWFSDSEYKAMAKQCPCLCVTQLPFLLQVEEI